MQGSPKYLFSYAFTVGNNYILNVIIYVILCMCILKPHQLLFFLTALGLNVSRPSKTLGMSYNIYSLK